MSSRRLLASGPTALLLQSTAIARKELTEIVRQPRLVLTLVVGPFLILFLFGGSYREDSVLMRTLFVGPPGSAYGRAIDQYEAELEQYVRRVQGRRPRRWSRAPGGAAHDGSAPVARRRREPRPPPAEVAPATAVAPGVRARRRVPRHAPLARVLQLLECCNHRPHHGGLSGKAAW